MYDRRIAFLLAVLSALPLYALPLRADGPAADPAVVAAETQKDLKALEKPVALLKDRRYEAFRQEQHAAVSAIFGALPRRIATLKACGRTPELAGASEQASASVRDAAAAEGELWAALTAQRRSGKTALPDSLAVPLTARIEAASSAVSRLIAAGAAAGAETRGAAAREPEAEGLRAGVDQAKSSISGMASATKDPADLPRVFENNNRRGDVDGSVTRVQAAPAGVRSAPPTADAGKPAAAQGFVMQAPPRPIQARAESSAPILAGAGPLSFSLAFSHAAQAAGASGLPIAAARTVGPSAKTAGAATGAQAGQPAAPLAGAAALDARVALPAAPEPCALALGDHESLAAMCRKYPRFAPLLAGLLDAFKEQFGTVSGVLTNLAFLLMGLLLSVVSGFGLIAKVVVSLVSLGLLATTFYGLIKEGWGAFRQWQGARQGSAEYFNSFRRVGKIGGTVVILALMALLGWGAGKTKPGRAMADGMTGALKGKLTSLGVADRVGSMDANIPAPVKAMLSKIFGSPTPAEPVPAQAPAEPAAAPQLAGAGPVSPMAAEPTRMARAQEAVGRELNTAQQTAVQRAHEVGAGLIGKDGGRAQIGNYTQAQLRQKAGVLKEVGFSSKDIRALMERGIVGEEAPRPVTHADARAQVIASHQARFERYVRSVGLDPKKIQARERGALLDDYLAEQGVAENAPLAKVLRGEPAAAPAAGRAEAAPAASAPRPAASATPLGRAAQRYADRYGLPAGEVEAALAKAASEKGLAPMLKSLPEQAQTTQLNHLLLSEEFLKRPELARYAKPEFNGFSENSYQAAKRTFESHSSYHKLAGLATDGGKLSQSGTRLFRHIHQEEFARIMKDKGLIPQAFKGGGEEIGPALTQAGGPWGLVERRVIDNGQAKRFLYEYTQHAERSGLGASVSTAGGIKIEIVPRAGQTFYSTNSIGNSVIGKNELGWATLDPISIGQVKIFGAGCEAGCFLSTEAGQALARTLSGSR